MLSEVEAWRHAPGAPLGRTPHVQRMTEPDYGMTIDDYTGLRRIMTD